MCVSVSVSVCVCVCVLRVCLGLGALVWSVCLCVSSCVSGVWYRVRRVCRIPVVDTAHTQTHYDVLTHINITTHTHSTTAARARVQ